MCFVDARVSVQAYKPHVINSNLGRKPHVVMFADIDECKERVTTVTAAALSENKSSTKGECMHRLKLLSNHA